MTHAPTGDRGQRYEVQGQDRATGVWHVIGWTDSSDGGRLAEGTRMWPRWSDVRVIDRGKKDDAESDDNGS